MPRKSGSGAARSSLSYPSSPTELELAALLGLCLEDEAPLGSIDLGFDNFCRGGVEGVLLRVDLSITG